jgi:hypothetical protein
LPSSPGRAAASAAPSPPTWPAADTPSERPTSMPRRQSAPAGPLRQQRRRAGHRPDLGAKGRGAQDDAGGQRARHDERHRRPRWRGCSRPAAVTSSTSPPSPASSPRRARSPATCSPPSRWQVRSAASSRGRVHCW